MIFMQFLETLLVGYCLFRTVETYTILSRFILQHIIKTYYNNVLKIRDIHLNKTCDNCNCIAYIYNQQLFSRR